MPGRHVEPRDGPGATGSARPSGRRMNMPDFNLRELVRDVARAAETPDPHLLAKEVNRRIRKSDREAALEQALQVVVYSVISRDRHQFSPSGQMRFDDQH